MSTPRAYHTAVPLQGGRVLITGGVSGVVTGMPGLSPDCEGFTNSAEVFDPAQQTFSSTTPMLIQRAQHAAAALSSGKVFVSGGVWNHASFVCDPSAAPEGNPLFTELLDLATGSFTSAERALTTARVGHTATVLKDGSVLILGGGLDTAELYP